MPYAGDLGVAYGEDQETDSFFAAEVSATGANRRGAAKYPTTRKFRELAEEMNKADYRLGTDSEIGQIAPRAYVHEDNFS